MSKSIIQKEKECWVTGKTNWLEEHHIFTGNPNRQNSEKYGLKVYLHYDYHRGKKGVHSGNRELADMLQKVGQKAFEEKCGTRQDFMFIFGKNYL